MGARRGRNGPGARGSGSGATRVGRWYAMGPEDRSFVAGDPAFCILRVVSDDAAAPGCVTVENAAGQRFPLPIPLLDAIAVPAEQQAGDLLDQPAGQRRHEA